MKRLGRVTWRLLRLFGLLVCVVVLMAQVAVSAAVVVAARTDHQMIVVTGGSMKPTIPLGSAMLVRRVQPGEDLVGKTVTFKPDNGTLVTHRVLAERTIKDVRYLQTKGDNNPEPDPDFVARSAVIGVPVWWLPHLGRAVLVLFSPLGRLLIFGPPLLVLFLVEARLVFRLLRELGHDSEGEVREVVCEPMEVGREKSPRQNRRSVLVAVCLTLLLSMVLGVLWQRSNAVFTDADLVTGNTVSTATVAAPSGVTASVGTGRVEVSWSPSVSSFVTGYRVYRSASSGGPYALLDSVTGSAATAYQDTTASGTVYYVVRAVAGNWESVDSAEASATVASDIPAPVAAIIGTRWPMCRLRGMRRRS